MFISETTVLNIVERGWIPDWLIRHGIRTRLRRTLAALPQHDCEAALRHTLDFIAKMDASAIAEVPQRANEQHYEVPAEFFAQVLGPQRKYSSGYWPAGVTTLAEAEEASLQATAEHAGIADHMRVLELGCGWGAFSLWAARRFPNSQFVAVSNSHSQRAWIESQIAAESLTNLEIITADMNQFAPQTSVDRIVSIEMFEHMRNWRALFSRVHDWLTPDGQCLIHVFCHRTLPYVYDDRGLDDWMSHYFFAGGIMPSDDLPLYLHDHLRVVDRWRWNGQHYAHTLNAWLAQMDHARAAVWPILETTYGVEQAACWWMRWRLFFMACAELFAFNRGQEWWVSHYLLQKP